ncbi:MAG: hypothetical protein RLZ12_336 [Bacillota bacterium]|jgi:large subunit ribosomal protein L30
MPKKQELTVTLKRSMIGVRSKERSTLQALGLKKRESSVVVPANDAMLGMINTIKHLVVVK